MVTISAVVNSGLATDHGLAVCFGPTVVEGTVGFPAVEWTVVDLTVTVAVPWVVAPGSVPERRNIS